MSNLYNLSSKYSYIYKCIYQGVWLEEKMEIFKSDRITFKFWFLSLQLSGTVKTTYILWEVYFWKKKSKYVYICVGGIFFPFPYLDFQNYLHQICIPSIVEIYQIPHLQGYLYLKNDISEMI